MRVIRAAERDDGARPRARSVRFGRLQLVLGHEIDRARLQLGEYLADIFAHDPDHDQLHAAQHHQADNDRRIARYGPSKDDCLDQDLHAEHERGAREQQAEHAGKPQRRDRERGEAFDRQAEQRMEVPGAVSMRARGRLIVDAQLPEADPARETLEETVALGELIAARRRRAERAGGSRRHPPGSSGARPN